MCQFTDVMLDCKFRIYQLLTFCFRDTAKILTLNPGEVVLYYWKNTVGKRVLLWSNGSEKNRNNELVEVNNYKPE